MKPVRISEADLQSKIDQGGAVDEPEKKAEPVKKKEPKRPDPLQKAIVKAIEGNKEVSDAVKGISQDLRDTAKSIIDDNAGHIEVVKAVDDMVNTINARADDIMSALLRPKRLTVVRNKEDVMTHIDITPLKKGKK